MSHSNQTPYTMKLGPRSATDLFAEFWQMLALRVLPAFLVLIGISLIPVILIASSRVHLLRLIVEVFSDPFEDIIFIFGILGISYVLSVFAVCGKITITAKEIVFSWGKWAHFKDRLIAFDDLQRVTIFSNGSGFFFIRPKSKGFGYRLIFFARSVDEVNVLKSVLFTVKPSLVLRQKNTISSVLYFLAIVLGASLVMTCFLTGILYFGK